MTPHPAPRAIQQGNAIREFYVLEQHLTTNLNRVLRPLGLSVTGVSYLSHLQGIGGRSSLNGLAAAMEATASAVSKTTRTLQDLGMVQLEQVAGDGRRRDVVLTAAGTRGLQDAQQRMDTVVGPMMAELADQQVAELTTVLRTMATRLES